MTDQKFLNDFVLQVKLLKDIYGFFFKATFPQQLKVDISRVKANKYCVKDSSI